MFFRKMINKKMTALQAELIEKHYTETKNTYLQMRSWQHDYRNHMQTLKIFLAMKEYGKLGQYLEELANSVDNIEIIAYIM